MKISVNFTPGARCSRIYGRPFIEVLYILGVALLLAAGTYFKMYYDKINTGYSAKGIVSYIESREAINAKEGYYYIYKLTWEYNGRKNSKRYGREEKQQPGIYDIYIYDNGNTATFADDIKLGTAFWNCLVTGIAICSLGIYRLITRHLTIEKNF